MGSYHRRIACFLGLFLVVAGAGGVVRFEWLDMPCSVGPPPAEAAPPITSTLAANIATDSTGFSAPYAVVVATGGDVEVEILPAAPGVAFTNNMYYFSTSSPLFVGTNRDVGTVTNLGTFLDGTELVFGIETPQGHTYVTGPGEENPDGIVHAIVEADSPGTVTVRFEDLFAGGDLSFRDAVIRVTGASVR
jgi:hypothetical protein